MEKVSAGSPPRSSGEGPAACTGAERSVTSAPTSKGARIRRLVFVRRRRPIDWLNSLIIGAVLNLEFIVYFLSLHVGLALPYQSLARRFVLYPCNRTVGLHRRTARKTIQTTKQYCCESGLSRGENR